MPGMSQAHVKLLGQNCTFPFDLLPGEIRNQILDLCIRNALNHRGKPSSRSIGMNHSALPDLAIELSIRPRWSGPVRLRTIGIGSMGLLFVNKRMYDELLSLIRSRVQILQIGGYILQHPKDNLSRWELLYPHLMDPYLFQYIKSIKLKLPSSRADIDRKNDSMRGFSMTGFIGHEPSPRCEATLSVVPGLVKCLQKFGSLMDLEITIVVQTTSPPVFEQLLPLYDICGKCTTVRFVGPIGYSVVDFRISSERWVEQWDIAWKDCLIRNERQRDGNLD